MATRTAYPKGIERQYRAALRRRIAFLIGEAKRDLRRNKTLFAARISETHRLDDDPVSEFMSALQQKLVTQFMSRWSLADNLASLMSGKNREDLQQSLGFDLFAAEPGLAPLLENWTAQNVNLIKDVEDQTLRRIETVIREGFMRGEAPATIAKALTEAAGLPEKRARFIARDQVGTLNGMLTKQRNLAVGITKYRWSSSHDSRVRNSHAARDGKIFSFSDSPIPGEEVNCRCVAIPVTDPKAKIDGKPTDFETTDKPKVTRHEARAQEILKARDDRRKARAEAARQ